MAIRTTFTQKFRNLDGSVLSDRLTPGAEVKEITLREACVTALLANMQSDTPKQKFNNYRMAIRIQDNDELDLSTEEIELLKKRIGEVFPPLYVGNAYMMLDPPAKE